MFRTNQAQSTISVLFLFVHLLLSFCTVPEPNFGFRCAHLFCILILTLKWTFCAQQLPYLSWQQYDVHQELPCLMKSPNTLHAGPGGGLQLSPPEGGWGEALKGLSEVLIAQICRTRKLKISEKQLNHRRI